MEGVLSHDARLDAARATIDYLMGRDDDEMARAVPNCPGWTVYNAAVHVGKVSIAWEGMINSSPDTPDARDKAYAVAFEQPEGSSVADLAAWAHSAVDALDTDDLERACFFSMTGGHGTVALWGWHASSELAVHRLDIADALGHSDVLADDEAIDATMYAARFFLPAMRRVTEVDPGSVTMELVGHDGAVAATAVLESDDGPDVTVRGPADQVLLAIWGRAHFGVEVTGGDPAVWDAWRELPSQAFQFGTWD